MWNHQKGLFGLSSEGKSIHAPLYKGSSVDVMDVSAGVGERMAKIEKRSVPPTAPAWVYQVFYKEKKRILLNDEATLIWAANWGALEFHVPMDLYQQSNFPTELIFDLDGPDHQSFDLVVEVAFKLKQVLDSLDLRSVVKTSGGTGLHIHVPIEPVYSFQETRRVNRFIA